MMDEGVGNVGVNNDSEEKKITHIQEVCGFSVELGVMGGKGDVRV